MLGTMARRRKPQSEASTQRHPLAQWRALHRVTQEEVARRCDVSQPHLSKIEHFEQIPIRDMLERLLAYTGLPVEAFVRPRHFLEHDPHFLGRLEPKPC